MKPHTGYITLRSIFSVLILTILGLTGCSGLWVELGDLRLWAVPDSVTILGDALPEAENEVYTDPERSIRVNTAINEVASFQLVMASVGASVNVWGVTVADLRQGESVIPAEQVRLYRQERVVAEDFPVWYLRLTSELRSPKRIPDPLIPLTAPRGALPIELKPGQCQALWIDIDVPLGTQPGLYRSTLRVITHGGTVHKLKLLVNVWPFALPQTHHLTVLTGLETTKLFRCGLEVDGQPYAPARLSFEDPAYQRAVNYLDQTFQLLHEHRCSPMLLDVYPIRRVGIGGQIELDWADYDRLVTGLLDVPLLKTVSRSRLGRCRFPIMSRRRKLMAGGDLRNTKVYWLIISVSVLNILIGKVG